MLSRIVAVSDDRNFWALPPRLVGALLQIPQRGRGVPVRLGVKVGDFRLGVEVGDFRMLPPLVKSPSAGRTLSTGPIDSISGASQPRDAERRHLSVQQKKIQIWGRLHLGCGRLHTYHGTENHLLTMLGSFEVSSGAQACTMEEVLR